jgi:hypothetical protein
MQHFAHWHGWDQDYDYGREAALEGVGNESGADSKWLAMIFRWVVSGGGRGDI